MDIKKSGLGPTAYIALAILIAVLAVGLLYAYRAYSTPAM